MNIVYAQQSRQILDLLVGFKISPTLWKHIVRNKENSLSAGRCQTPAVKLIYENQKEIDENPDLYEEMYMQPMFADYQKVNKFFDKDRFLNWFDKNVYKGVLNG